MQNLDDLLALRLDAVGDWQPTSLRLAAVLCPLVAHAGEDHLLLLVRPAGTHPHAGQIGFPGGMRTGDETPTACALRECAEEIGVPANGVHVLGGLPPRSSSSGILVHCLVGRMTPVALVPDPAEVERVLLVPVRWLADPQHWQERTPPVTATGRQLPSSPHFEFGDDLLWGLTARFVRDLTARLA